MVSELLSGNRALLSRLENPEFLKSVVLQKNGLENWVYRNRANPERDMLEIPQEFSVFSSVSPCVVIVNQSTGKNIYLTGRTFQSHAEVCDQHSYNSNSPFVHGGFVCQLKESTVKIVSVGNHRDLNFEQIAEQTGGSTVFLNNYDKPFYISIT